MIRGRRRACTRGMTLFGYSRAAVKSRPQAESGICRYEFSIDPDSDQWQAVEGGVVYFSGNTIHTLLGAGGSVGRGGRDAIAASREGCYNFVVISDVV